MKRAGREPAGFPLRVAGIDVGSNAMRLIAAEFTSPSTWTVLAEQRVAVRLGAAVFGADGGRLDAAVMEAALEALLSFRQRMDELGVVHYRAAATSAVREAANGSAFVQRALEQAGIVLDTITAGEEARLVWLAVASRIDVADERWILVDLGGGSVEIAIAESDAVLRSESHAMGAVRMLAEFADAVATPRRFRTLAGEYIDTLMSRMALEASPGGGLVATGGNIEELARMSRAKTRNGVARLEVADLSGTIDQLADLTAAQRIEHYGLRPDRADVVLPAALVYERIARIAQVDELIVPGVGLKDGLLLDAMQHAVHDAGHSLRQERDIGTGAIALGRRYLFDEAHARHVAALALSLFDQLEELHGLDDHDRRLLLAASLLHDIGQFISYRRHHKHSFYLIQHASLPDLTSNDTLLVALVARYHRRAEPSREHDEFRDLKDREQDRVAHMAALLRVADALDRQHRQHVTGVTARVIGDTLHLDVTARGDVELEEWALEKKARLIARVLDLDVELHTSGAGGPQ